jgi:hypothetical protein
LAFFEFWLIIKNLETLKNQIFKKVLGRIFQQFLIIKNSDSSKILTFKKLLLFKNTFATTRSNLKLVTTVIRGGSFLQIAVYKENGKHNMPIDFLSGNTRQQWRCFVSALCPTYNLRSYQPHVYVRYGHSDHKTSIRDLQIPYVNLRPVSAHSQFQLPTNAYRILHRTTEFVG